MKIDTSLTSKKFLDLTSEVLQTLINGLEKLHFLEAETFESYQLLTAKRSVPNQTHPDEQQLWDDYFKQAKIILDQICTQPSKDYSRSFGKPTKYEFLQNQDTWYKIIIKSELKAVVEVYYTYGVDRKNQFVLKKIDENWKIDSKKYGFLSEDKWMKDSI